MQRYLLILLLFLAKLLKADIFSSVQHLTNAFEVERKMVEALSGYLTKTEEQLEHIRRYLRDYEQVGEEAKLLHQIGSSSQRTELEMAKNLAENPLQAFHFAKRLTMDWKYLRDLDPLADWQEVENVIQTNENFDYSQLSGEEELEGSAQALIILQSIYQLDITSLIKGNIAGIQTASELTASDCLYLGTHSLNLEMYFNAVLWLEQAFALAGSEEDTSATQDEVLPFLNKAYEAFGDNGVGLLLPKLVSRRMNNTLSILNSISKTKFQLGEHVNFVEAHRNYEALCRGEQLLADDEVAELTCYYDNRNSSYLILMPAKTERHNIDPEILVFHDVISDNEIEAIKFLANPELERRLVQGKSRPHGGESTQARISKVAWLERDVEQFFFKKMGLRVNALTGLDTTSIGSAETLQVANYGTGGHYNPHVDFLSINEIVETEDEEGHVVSFSVGDRVATFMVYLSDVNRGGATAFPRLGVSVFPKKGSATFWFNLKKSGNGDHLTLHGGCPVAHGSKWVGNKWIKEMNQMFLRPCSLSKED